MTDDEATPTTADARYAERLDTLGHKRWKQVLNVQYPYQRNIRRLQLGRALDVGCGNGRNLVSMPPGSVGVDHNPDLVQSARALGLTAYTTEEFFGDPKLSAPGSFDSLVAAHVIEHLQPAEAKEIIASYLPFVKPNGKVVWITPQERGYKTDYTHVHFSDFAFLRELAGDLGLHVVRQYSFPFPRWVGKVFPYNEFVQLARTPS